jgi:hypothetical protein
VSGLAAFALLGWLVLPGQQLAGRPWVRHTIDDSSDGADGAKLQDLDGDGRPEIATAWEEGGAIRVYSSPAGSDPRVPWRSVTVGHVRSPEDAVLVDVDADGAVDVVSSCEGEERSLFVHWAPHDRRRTWEEAAWRTEPIPATVGVQRWMFAEPLQVDGRNGIDLVAGGKGRGAALGWLEAPARPRELRAWRWHELRRVGWLMSLRLLDMDGDGDPDILFSDRFGPGAGVFWLENPGAAAVRRGARWPEHAIGALGREVMFIDSADVDGDGLADVVAAVKPREVRVYRRLGPDGLRWSARVLFLPPVTGTAKAVRVGNLDRDFRPEIVWSSEQAWQAPGVVWLSLPQAEQGDHVRLVHDVSGAEGVKYDLIQLVDVDGDGDLDVVTTEEVAGLGLVWYENPARER